MSAKQRDQVDALLTKTPMNQVKSPARRKTLFLILVSLLLFSASIGLYWHFEEASNPELDLRWQPSNEQSATTVDHQLWQSVLDNYLVTDTDSGVNLFDYAGLLDDGREPLDDYIQHLRSINPLNLNRLEQKAFWINLYNAATVRLIIDNYPLSTITSLGSSVTSFGPWDDSAVTINAISLSLNEIEHRIIRPLYDDHRIHFAVNCASIGCPDLAADAFTAQDMDKQLDEAAAAYVNHPRGVNFEGKNLHLSSLFKWYDKDFGDTLTDVLSTLGNYASSDNRKLLIHYQGTPTYAYDWSLNGYCQVNEDCGE